MDFELSDTQHAILEVAQNFASAEIAPHAQAWDRAGEIPRALWHQLAELGFGGVFVSDEAGGAGLSRLDGTLVFEGLAAGCASVAAFLSIHNMCAGMIDRFGTQAQKTALLPGALSMERFLAYCLTEPGAGSDAAALSTRAVRAGGHYALTGTKAFISGGGYADTYIVMARTDGPGADGISAFLMDDGTEGLSFGALEDKMGWRSQPTRAVQMDGCMVPESQMLGAQGQGFRLAMAGLDGGRLNIAACSLGAAQAALDKTRAYMAERRAFGRSIDQFQALQFRLADMEVQLQAARVLLRQAAWKLDQGAPDATHHCAMAKLFVTEAGSAVVNQCLQLHGGYGYLADYGIEKRVRDLRVHEILEGTNEIMRVIIARGLVPN